MKKRYFTINRSKFVEKLSTRQSKLGNEVIQDSTNKIFDYLSYALSQGERIEIRGFGSFFLRHRKERSARNPQTGEQFRLQRRSVPHFKPGKKLRTLVDNSDSGLPIAPDSPAIIPPSHTE